MKQCKKCNISKSVKEFSKHPQTKDRLQPICKECDKNRWRTIEGLADRIFINQKINSKRRKHPLPKYKKQEFIKWCVENKTFNYLYKQWKTNKYLKHLTPSIDRIDDYKGYCFNNIRVCTWEENHLKASIDRKTGINNKINIKVEQIDKETGKVINIFNSIRIAARKLKLDHSGISKCCKGKIKTCGGYVWKYSKV